MSSTKSPRPSFFHHLHPPTIPAAQARWRYTLGAGGLSMLLVVVLLLTGTLEMFYYVPTPERAATSIQTLTFLAPYGAVVRNLHYWSAQLLVLVASLHLMRVLLTGAYSGARRFNYLLGLFLWMLILFLDFSGYVLRWDEGVRWALVAGTNLLQTIPVIGTGLYRFIVGGLEPGPSTLLRFYSWHIFGLTLILVIIIAWHIFRVRRDGGIAIPPAAVRSDQERISRYELVRREGFAALLAGAVLVLLAVRFPAPIAPPISPDSLAVADARAPWFFLWIQQLLKLGNPFFFGVLIPFGFLLVLVAIPYIYPQGKEEQLGRWFPQAGRPVQVGILFMTSLLIVLTVLALLQNPV